LSCKSLNHHTTPRVQPQCKVLPSNSEMTECSVSLTLLLAFCLVATTMEKRPPLMVRKFLQDQGRPWEDDPNVDYNAFRKELYFFYGSLMDPSTLVHVLKLRDRPQLLPSKIIGYSYMLWGQYPALLDGPPHHHTACHSAPLRAEWLMLALSPTKDRPQIL
jgi:hypothetical protein